MHEGRGKPHGSLISLGGNESMKVLSYRDLRATPDCLDKHRCLCGGCSLIAAVIPGSNAVPECSAQPECIAASLTLTRMARPWRCFLTLSTLVSHVRSAGISTVRPSPNFMRGLDAAAGHSFPAPVSCGLLSLAEPKATACQYAG